MRAQFRTITKEPTQEDIDEHNLDHAQFRSWCPHCIKGRAKSYPHLTKKNKDRDNPIINIDYAFMNDDRDKKDDQDKGMPIIVMKDDETTLNIARVVPKKGVDPYAADRIKKDIEQFGHRK